MAKNLTRIASHRGGTLEFGDSAPTGFRKTALMPLEEVEFDVHPTADGAIVVHHDPTLDRTTNMVGEIAGMDLDQIRQAVIQDMTGEHPLTLDELCEIYRFSPVILRCEFKPGTDGKAYRGFVKPVLERLQALSMLERSYFTSFLIETLAEIGEITDRPRVWLVSPPVLRQLGLANVIGLAKAHGVEEISVQIDELTAETVEVTQSAGLRIGAYAAHSRPQMEKALDLGVTVFTTDRPSLAIRVRAEWTKENGK